MLPLHFIATVPHILVCLPRYPGSASPLAGQQLRDSWDHSFVLPYDAGKEHRALQSACKSHWLMWITLLSTGQLCVTHWWASTGETGLELTATMNKTLSEPILFSDNTFCILFFLVTLLGFFLLIPLLFSLKNNHVDKLHAARMLDNRIFHKNMKEKQSIKCRFESEDKVLHFIFDHYISFVPQTPRMERVWAYQAS